jgi:hypothetical protein
MIVLEYLQIASWALFVDGCVVALINVDDCYTVFALSWATFLIRRSIERATLLRRT